MPELNSATIVVVDNPGIDSGDHEPTAGALHTLFSSFRSSIASGTSATSFVTLQHLAFTDRKQRTEPFIRKGLDTRLTG